MAVAVNESKMNLLMELGVEFTYHRNGYNDGSPESLLTSAYSMLDCIERANLARIYHTDNDEMAEIFGDWDFSVTSYFLAIIILRGLQALNNRYSLIDPREIEYESIDESFFNLVEDILRGCKERKIKLRKKSVTALEAIYPWTYEDPNMGVSKVGTSIVRTFLDDVKRAITR